MQHFNVITRRGFLDRSIKTGLAVALSTLTDIPLVMKRALAEGTLGLNNKKLLFIWLRFGNDSINSVIPFKDSAYNNTNRPSLFISQDPGTNYNTLGQADFPVSSSDPASADFPTFRYTDVISLGNGFAGLHPSLKFLAPVYNAGDLCLVHRVGYPKLTRSHFDSQVYWENGNPNDNLSKDGILYRTIIEAMTASPAVAGRALTGVSVQSSLPLILRGSAAALTNLSDPTRYDLLGVPNDASGNSKASAALTAANAFPFPPKLNRELLSLQYQNMSNTLQVFAGIDFSEAGNTFQDDTKTDGDTAWTPINGAGASIGDPSKGYFLFPTSNDKNGGWRRGAGNNTDGNKYVVDTAAYNATGTGYFNSLKAAALILNKTEAVVAGTEMRDVNIDTHKAQGTLSYNAGNNATSNTASHPNLQRRIAWTLYSLRKYFLQHADQCTWDNLVVVTLSEFGRTTIENADLGTDHGEAGVMFVAGGGVNGFVPGSAGNPPVRSGVYGCGPSDPVPWVSGQNGSMFGVESRYLKRCFDYRSVLGEVIRKHLGATQNQLNRIIPGYANEAQEHLLGGGTVMPPLEKDASHITQIQGEAGLL